jgi:REP element-mobilizing transposase RayT
MAQRAHALRTGRFSESGRVYLVTTVTTGRSPLFNDFRLARLTIRALQAPNAPDTCRTLAFVLMPDHLHWLLELRAASLSSVVGHFKAKASAAINRETGSPGVQRWQRGFHDHAVRQEEDLATLARYVVSNPLRAGLAQGGGGYPHWDAAWV